MKVVETRGFQFSRVANIGRRIVRPNEKLSGNATALRRQAKREGVAAVAFPLERRVRHALKVGEPGGVVLGGSRCDTKRGGCKETDAAQRAREARNC